MRSYTKEQLQNFTLKELEKVPDDLVMKLGISNMKRYLKLLNSAEKKIDQPTEKLSIDEYPKLSLDGKAKFWAGQMHRSMRWQSESGLNPYSIYSESGLIEILKFDPNFMQLLPRIYNIWSGTFDSEKVDRIMQKQYKNILKNHKIG